MTAHPCVVIGVVRLSQLYILRQWPPFETSPRVLSIITAIVRLTIRIQSPNFQWRLNKSIKKLQAR